MILERDNFVCHWCGEEATTVDYLRALVDGGTALDPENGHGDREDPDKGAAAARKMAADPRTIAAVGPFTSPTAGAMIPITNRAGLLDCSPSTTWGGLTRPDDGALKLRSAYPRRINFVRLSPYDAVLSRAIHGRRQTLRTRRTRFRQRDRLSRRNVGARRGTPAVDDSLILCTECKHDVDEFTALAEGWRYWSDGTRSCRTARSALDGSSHPTLPRACLSFGGVDEREGDPAKSRSR